MLARRRHSRDLTALRKAASKKTLEPIRCAERGGGACARSLALLPLGQKRACDCLGRFLAPAR